jgi:Sec-independent protein translocase protein TatA
MDGWKKYLVIAVVVVAVLYAATKIPALKNFLRPAT